MKFLKNSLPLLLLYFCINIQQTIAQGGAMLDEIIAVIGDEIATKSELENRYAAFLAQNGPSGENTKCEIFEDILFSKMLLNQSKLDSVEVAPGQIEGELDRRMRYYIEQFGSEQALEAYYKKTVKQIKSEFRESLREQMLVQTVQGDISSGVKVTPEEVRAYYDKIPKDSLPLINAEIEMAHVVVNVKTSQEAINSVKEKLKEYKKRVSEGEKFSTLAVLYSEDQGSAVQGGEIGFVGRAEVEPEFGAAAFKLKEGGVSPIVKTRYGYHIIQLIERRGTKVNVRHILLKPKQDKASFEKAEKKADSIATLIRSGEITFKEAAKKFSEDEETFNNGGIVVNPFTASSMIPMDGIDPSTFLVIDKLEKNEISKAVLQSDPRKAPGYRIIKLLQRTEPHQANLEDDYQKIRSAALAEKEQKVLQEWMTEAIGKTYIKIDTKYTEGCKFMQPWLKNLAVE